MNSEKVEIGKIQVPEDKQKWMKHVTRDGTVYATPPGGRKYTDTQRRSVDESDKRVRAAFVKKAKQLRDAESGALRDLKRDPFSDKLRAAAERAKAERVAFDKERPSAEAKARREAREKALK